MGTSKILEQNEVRITTVKTAENGIIIRVAKSKGMIRKESISFGEDNKDGILTLLFNGMPLVKFHSEYYFSPTCPMLISAGYGLDRCDDGLLMEMSDALNSPFVNIETSLEIIKPLIGLLEDGYYLIADRQLFPTDGEGAFFWRLKNAGRYNGATKMLELTGSDYWSEQDPGYLLPTQPPSRFNEGRVGYYRGNTETRAIAYYMEGYLCALLDGHHKATAAALDGRPVNALVIIPAQGIEPPQTANDEGFVIYFTENTYLTDKDFDCSYEEAVDAYSGEDAAGVTDSPDFSPTNSSFDRFKWPKNILGTAENYPVISSYEKKHRLGDLSSKRLNAIISGNETPSPKMLDRIVYALSKKKDRNFVEFCFALYKKGCPPKVLRSIFYHLAWTDFAEVEDFFLEFLSHDDGARPDVTEIAKNYVAGKKNPVRGMSVYTAIL